jgi:hypothetical protein
MSANYLSPAFQDGQIVHYFNMPIVEFLTWIQLPTRLISGAHCTTKSSRTCVAALKQDSHRLGCSLRWELTYTFGMRMRATDMDSHHSSLDV